MASYYDTQYEVEGMWQVNLMIIVMFALIIWGALYVEDMRKQAVKHQQCVQDYGQEYCNYLE